ncbi:RagB/SusD domain-containing protein [Mucilaginibacter frigoritolerans]|uniref:RagB/SusD domain-containing protein n=1 Tax=Mucilaginibacter frigoritolerans TaxID=652788 RepID=A0A562TP13_9SPHI|nr:RagB/SusD family nutrient uptake outer membrane protein [Mucilaginibacter frigoritolerans]TWI95319.1 RagB/SusD domain-containing protein [Mucilaginibacter frigoritolerans]
MKKIFFNINKIIIGLLLVAGLLASCKKLIEIPTNPPSFVSQQEEFADSASTISAVAGVYTYNPGNGFAYSDGNLTICTALSADELTTSISSDAQQFYTYTLTPLNGRVTSNLWPLPYQSIFQVNSVLSGVANNSALSAALQKQITGEMEVVRALYYFNLVNMFGGVPLVTTTNYAVTARLPRATTAAIYAQIKADLTDAEKKLTAAYPSSGHIRPNLYTAVALLAKVDLYLGNWQSAYNEANSVINSGLYSVANVPLNGVFLDGSNEAIWQLPANGLYSVYSDAANFLPQYSGATPNYLVTPFLLNAFEAGDQRLQNWIGSTSVNNQTLYYANKYKNLDPTVTTEDQMVLRLGEVYLIRAEAAAQLNNLTQALADVNTIRARAGLAPSTATSQAAVLSAVMHERQVELFCEWGNRWFDLKRTGTAAAVLGAEKTGFTANAELYPVPQAQIQLDNLLTQNPGY